MGNLGIYKNIYKNIATFAPILTILGMRLLFTIVAYVDSNRANW